MILTNKILEAVNRGILLALDDFEDEELILNVKSKQILNRDYTKEYLDLKELFVDLGLPSGTWWAKKNLGATCEDTLESWCGDYYSFGDPESNKDVWGEALYKFTGKMIKYRANYGLTNLEPEDDQATLLIHIHNFNIHIPTMEQCIELKNNCEIIPTNGTILLKFKALDMPWNLNGYTVKSKINGNEIFIPSAGYYFITDNNQINEHCAIQSSTVYEGDPYRYYGLMFDKNRAMLNSSYYRTAGLPIRPVCDFK